MKYIVMYGFLVPVNNEEDYKEYYEDMFEAIRDFK